ncbi:MAG TPA: hypothetical protein VLW85_24790 [Myxococcales bacterium]|nr:hypothetical protein [Myxococcales bacterium]
MSCRSTALAALLLAPFAARAQLVETSIPVTGDLNWSATAGRTIGQNNSALQAEAGWPGIGFTWLHGIDPRSDVGLHVGFNYGLEGTTNTTAGVNVAVPYRRTLGGLGDTSFLFEMQPGFSMYGNNGGVLFGVGGPLGVVAGFKMSPQLTLDAAADVTVLWSFSNPAGFLFGPQVGGGFEYLLDPNLAVTGRVRVGPEFAFDTAGHGSQTAFQTLLGLAWNLR